MNVAIIAAAGSGSRMGGKRPKQFLELAGVPIIFHALLAFERCDSIQQIVTVLSAGETDGFLSIAKGHGIQKLATVVTGGETRAASVLQGLRAVDSAAEVVAVHDGVRPFVTCDEIARTVTAAKLEGAAILVSTPVDTVKEVRQGVVSRTLDRCTIRYALTPQCFDYRLLRRAYEQVDVLDQSFTDEASVVERMGAKIVTVEGSARNIKITRPEDLVMAEAILKSVSSEQ
ncbi:MAG TPA: 2-C-methyl-D-erythritol 4-phosphate cytidylyltransferase [Pyrinomonadaceae bacterium]|nr:2-C-methyl-D-erythritol 4-phosphate cytidylyltransferase [Pyrinomonadaceae bacterium]